MLLFMRYGAAKLGNWHEYDAIYSSNIRFWPIADIALAATNFGFGGKAAITVDGPECPLMTQSGHLVAKRMLSPPSLAMARNLGIA
jgi:hypothetical protein